MSDVPCLFFSYRRLDRQRAQPLLDALAAIGVTVWLDEVKISDQDPITDAIRRGIGTSAALLAFYSATYPESKPCQQEIRIAWLATQQRGEKGHKRVWLVNPEAGVEHIPELLRDQHVPYIPDDPIRLEQLARQFMNQLNGLAGSHLEDGFGDLPMYHGMSSVQTKRFYGRDADLWNLHGKLIANRISVVTGVYGQAAVQVRGLGGNGKSLLAREYAVQFGSAYPGGVFWLNAMGNGDLTESIDPTQLETARLDQIRQFLLQLESSIDSLDPTSMESLFWRTIQRRGEPCLWIVDDLPSGLPLRLFEQKWIAKWPGASTLITTRSREYGSLGTVLDLSVLSSHHAFDLISSHRRPDTTSQTEAIEAILRVLGYHPLAVDVTGGYLAAGVETPESYLDALLNPDEDALEVGALLKDALPTNHERSISATLLKSIRLLAPASLDFLRLASVLAASPIPVTLIVDIFELAYEARRTTLLLALDQAEMLSLCERFSDNARSVHSLVARTIIFQYPNAQKTEMLREAAIQALINRLRSGGHVRLHADMWMNMNHSRHLLEKGCHIHDEAVLADLVGQRDHEHADYASALQFRRLAVAYLIQECGEEHPETLTAMNNLGLTMTASGAFGQAEGILHDVVNKFNYMFGPFGELTLAAKCNLAALFLEQGRPYEARRLEEEVLPTLIQRLGQDNPLTLAVMNNLGRCLLTLGELAAAQGLLEQVYERRCMVLGREHPETLITANNLAQTLQMAAGQLARSLELFKETFTTRRKLFGEEHPDTLASMTDLAATMCRMGDMTGAVALQRRALDLSERVLGPSHPYTVTAMCTLGEILRRHGEKTHARTLLERTVSLGQSNLGFDHPETLNAGHWLAVTLFELGEIAAARDLETRVMHASRRRLGESHPATTMARRTLTEFGVTSPIGDSIMRRLWRRIWRGDPK